MTKSERIALSVAVRTLKSGTSDPQLVAEFLEQVLATYGTDPDEMMRPGGTP